MASVQDEHERAYLAHALAGVAACEFVANAGRLRGVIAQRNTNACLIDLNPPTDDGFVDVIRHVRRVHRFLPIIGYCSLDARGSQRLLAIVRAGVTHLLIRGYDNPALVVTEALQRTGWQWAADEVLRQLGELLPPHVQPIFAYVVAYADVAVSVEHIATALAVNRRTLGRQLRRAGLPGPEAVVSWCRLLVATQLMTRPDWSMQRAALALRFASTSALRAMLRRHCDLPADAIRQSDGLTRMIAAFRAACAPVPIADGTCPAE